MRIMLKVQIQFLISLNAPKNDIEYKMHQITSKLTYGINKYMHENLNKN